MKGKLKDLLQLSGGEWLVSFTTRENPVNAFYRLQNADLEISMSKANPKRSKDANDLCWALCTDIGNALKPPIPKDMVYKQAIRDVGEYVPLPIRGDAVETFQRIWASRGTGWFVEVVDDSKLSGYKRVFAYYGSSVYNTAQMSRLIDYLKQDAESMGIKIPFSAEEERRLLEKWGKK